MSQTTLATCDHALSGMDHYDFGTTRRNLLASAALAAAALASALLVGSFEDEPEPPSPAPIVRTSEVTRP